MSSRPMLGALAIATAAAYGTPANAAPDKSHELASNNGAIVTSVLEHQDASIQLLFGPDGLLQQGGVAGLLSDLDGKDGVEVSNRWMLTRILLGGSDQKEVVGEAQLFELLKGKNLAQLEELYIRITGDTSGLKISKQNIALRDGTYVAQGTISDFDAETQAKIRNFHTQLLLQVDVAAALTSILLDDPDARTGLKAVIDGELGHLLAMLDNPAKMEEFKKILAENGTLDRDPAILEKIASFLLRIGIAAGVPVSPGGTASAFMENEPLLIQNGLVTNDPWNLTASQGFGNNNSQSVSGSIDLAGIRLGLNGNDPKTRMEGEVAGINTAQDKITAAKQLVERVNFQYGGDSQDETIRAQVIALGNAYIRSQEQLDSLPDSPAKTDAIAKNTLTYLAKVEALQGLRWKGVFGMATATGWIVGPSATKVTTSASSANLKTGAGSIEAGVLDSEVLNTEKVAEYLKDLGITQEGNTYMQDGKVILTVPTGKLVQWRFEAVVTDRETIIQAIPQIISATTAPTSQIIRLKGKNSIARNSYIDKNQQAVATLAKSLRSNDSRMTDLEYSIALGNYAIATNQLKSILNESRDKTAMGLLGELNTLNTPESKRDFFDLFLGKTAGSVVSRKLGDRLENGQNIRKDLERYYERLVAPFAKQYGLEASQVREMFNAILPTVDNKNIRTLGETFGDGFNGMVAFNQRNAKQDFVVLATTKHANARTVGKPIGITGEGIAQKIREQIKTKITEDEARAFQQNNPALKGMNIDEVKTMMVAGPVSAYLSFDEGAACFNLGFAGVPGGVPVAGTNSIGTTVGVHEAGVTSLGVGFGRVWKKPKKEEKKEEPKQETKQETKPEEAKPAEPAKPVKPEPKPEVKPEPKPEVKPPVEPPKPPPKPPVEPPPCVPPTKPPAPPVTPPPHGKPDVCVPNPHPVHPKPPIEVKPPKPPVHVKPPVNGGENCVPEVIKGGVDHGKNIVKPTVDHVKNHVVQSTQDICTPVGKEVVNEGVKHAGQEGVKHAGQEGAKKAGEAISRH